MRNKTLLFLLLIPLLFSCNKGDFTVDNVDLERTITFTDSKRTERLVFSAECSERDAKYTFKLKSPDGILTWAGDLSNGRSEDLLITPSASFPEGDYSYIIYSEKGESMSGTVYLKRCEDSYNLEKDPSLFTYPESEGKEATYTYLDSYLNRIVINKSL